MQKFPFNLKNRASSPVLCLGEALVDILPVRQGQKLSEASLLRQFAGGSAANVAVGLARLGLPAAFLGKVGADPFGYFLRDCLSREGVDISGLVIGGSAPTGVAFAWVEDLATGEMRYHSLRYPSAERSLEVSEVALPEVAQACALQYGSLLLAASPSAAVFWAVLDQARTAAIPCFYDVNMRLPAWPSQAEARAAMLAPLEQSDLVKLNRHELAFLTGQTSLERAADELWRPNLKALVVTLDREGCYYRTATTDGRIAGLPVPVADTVGAGDAFMAALIAETVGGPDGWAGFDWLTAQVFTQACRRANAAAAFTVTRPGAIPALPTRRRLNRFMQKITA